MFIVGEGKDTTEQNRAYVTDIYDCMKDAGPIISYPFKPEKKEYVTHKIGILYRPTFPAEKRWAFYFLLYDLINYYVSLPDNTIYQNCMEEIKNYKD